MEFRSSRFSQLPAEVTSEILLLSSIESIIAFYQTYNIIPTCRDLYYVAERFEVPYATSLDIMLVHNHYRMEKRIEYCIEYGDARSLARLEKLYDEEISFELIPDDDIPRTRVFEILFWRKVGRGTKQLDSFDFALAFRNKSLDVVQYLVNNNVEIDYEEITDLSSYATEELLDVFFDAGYDIKEDILDVGVTYHNLFLVDYAIKKGATGSTVTMPGDNLDVLMRLIKTKDASIIAFERIVEYFTMEDIIAAANVIASRYPLSEVLERFVKEGVISRSYMEEILNAYTA